MRRLLYISNAFDDDTRHVRGVHTDSPAASRKTFAMCVALRQVGVHASVLSMGRGRVPASRRRFRMTVRRVHGVPVFYMPFTHLPFLSEALSTLSLAWMSFKLRGKRETTTFLFYNRTTAYLLPLLVAAFLGRRCVVDLEDGYIRPDHWTPAWGVTSVRAWIFDKLTVAALLANSALGRQTSVTPQLSFYGVATIRATSRDWQAPRLNILLGGTVAEDTGAPQLIAAINTLRAAGAQWASGLHFVITGKGDCIDAFRELSGTATAPSVEVLGRLTDEQYDQLLARCHAGLALKPNRGPLADTTFPSKVVEMAAAGLLIISTRISDVDKVLGKGAMYVESDDCAALLSVLQAVVADRSGADRTAREGTAAVANQCEVRAAGQLLADFLFPER